MNKKNKKAIVVYFIFIFCGTLSLAYNSKHAFADETKVILETQDIHLVYSGLVLLGDLTITALAEDTITGPCDVLLKIPENFPAFWDTGIKNVRLNIESASGLINEAVTYPDEKTLKINITNTWPKNSKITITNLRVNIPQFPSYEDIFSEKVVNLAQLSFSGFDSGGGIILSSGQILLKVPPLYAGDDGWTPGTSSSTGTVANYKFCDFESTYSAGYYLAGRGFQAKVYSVDSDDNWVNSTDTVIMSSFLSDVTPDASAGVTFYTDSTYSTDASTYALSGGMATVYGKCDTPSTVKLRAVCASVSSNSDDAITIEPYAYQISAYSPQTVNVGWSETVTLKDIHGNVITDSPPLAATVTSNGNAYFYPDNTYDSDDRGASRQYTLSNGTCAIYIKDEVAENINISADDTYNSLSNSGGGTSNLIVVTISLWQPKISFTYEEEEGTTSDKLTVLAWLEKDGSKVNDADLTSATVDIYDADTLKKSLTPNTDKDPDSNGDFWFTWENTGLDLGHSYFMRLSIVYRTSTHIAVEDLYMSMDKTLSSLIEASIADIKSLEATAQSISENVIEGISPQLVETKEDTAEAVTAIETSIPTQITNMKQELQPHIISRILNTETRIITGGTLIIRYRAPSGTSPVLDVYDEDKVKRIDNAAMTVTGNVNVYEYSVEFKSAWGLGFFTVICSEASYNTLDGTGINVVSADISSVSRDLSSVLGASSGMQSMSEVKDILNIEFDDIGSKLSEIGSQIAVTVSSTVEGVVTKNATEQADNIYSVMNEVSGAIQEIGISTEGGLNELYDVSQAGVKDLNYVRNKFIQLENILQINKKMIDNVTYEPVVQTWYEFR